MIGHAILGNDIGLGKTLVMLGLVELHTRLMVQKMEAGDAVVFRPSVVINPAATILQTANEILDYFPTIRVIVFYGNKALNKSKRFKTVTVEELESSLARLMSRSSRPQVGLGPLLIQHTLDLRPETYSPS